MTTPSAGAALSPGQSKRAIDRLDHLYKISKRLTRFDGVESSMPEVLALVGELVPLRSAILMLEQRSAPTGATRSIAWQSDDLSPAQLTEARAHATKAYGYLVPKVTPASDEPGSGRLSSTAPVSVRSEKTKYVVLPLVIDHSEIFGAIQLECVEELDESTLAFLDAMVNQVAIALDRALVIESNQAVELAQHFGSDLLSRISATLFSSLSYDVAVASAIRAAVPSLADVCIFDEVGADGTIRRAAVVVADPDKQALADRIQAFIPTPDSKTPEAEVLRTGVAAFFPRFRPDSLDDSRAALVSDLGVQSLMTVPLFARGRMFGVLTFIASDPKREYSRSDLALAEEIGRRAAIAIDNAKLYEQADRASRSKEDVLAIVSHDLRNPLNVILMSSQLVLESAIDEVPGLRKRIEAVERSAKRMERIIGDLVDSASIEAGQLTVELEPHAVEKLVWEAIESQKAVAAKKLLRLEGVLPKQSFGVHCDRDRVLQIFGNLIGNAIKFTPQGGVITVSASPHERDVTFSVRDTGPGIPAEDLQHLFDRYWQAKTTARLGSGLGLSIARGLVETHHGRIWVESTVGEGSTFFFTIPLVRSDDGSVCGTSLACEACPVLDQCQPEMDEPKLDER